jgi:hypothetical protein
MFSDYIDKYTKFQNDNTLLYDNHITFLSYNNKYYMFYNEKSRINANDLPIRFPFDGILKISNTDLFFYVAFDEEKKKTVLDKLKDYNVSVIDKEYKRIEFYKSGRFHTTKNNANGCYKKITSPPRKLPFINSLGITNKISTHFPTHIGKTPLFGNFGINLFQPFDIKILKDMTQNEICMFENKEIVPLKSNKISGVSIDEFEKADTTHNELSRRNHSNQESPISLTQSPIISIQQTKDNTVISIQNVKGFNRTISDFILEEYEVI